jgi:hypothetical protein
MKLGTHELNKAWKADSAELKYLPYARKGNSPLYAVRIAFFI